MSAHTPGPWVIAGRYGDTKVEIQPEDGHRAIATVWAFEQANHVIGDRPQWVEDPEGQANARLIVVVPRLLEAAKCAALMLRNGATVRSFRSVAADAASILEDAIAEAGS